MEQNIALCYKEMDQWTKETASKLRSEYRWRLKSPRCQFTPHFAHSDWLLRTLGPPLRSHRVRDKRNKRNKFVFEFHPLLVLLYSGDDKFYLYTFQTLYKSVFCKESEVLPVIFDCILFKIYNFTFASHRRRRSSVG